MQWIYNYQLFLFDFDGLLVNTEEIHYQAYIKMCADRGFNLTWNFIRYSEAAHHRSDGLRTQIYAQFPNLQQQEPDWNVLYEEKKACFLELLKEGAAHLMPGVRPLLEALAQANIKRAVVTHSATPLVSMIREQNPLLNTIPEWITRENYSHPKPNSECYQVAISKLGSPNDQIIGFEDSPRGLKALMDTQAKPVLVCSPDYPYVESLSQLPLAYYPSFTAITDHNHP